MKRILIISLLIIPLIYGCKENNNTDDEYTIEEQARDGLYDLMQYVYLWYDKMPDVTLSDYDGPEDLLEALRYQEKDKWSFVYDYDSFMESMEGTFVGHGISMALDESDKVRVARLYTGSDLWSQGVRRGWIIEKINDTPLAPILIAGDEEAYDDLLGASEVGITNKFLFKNPDGDTVTYRSTKASFTLNSVMATEILDLTSGKTGYLCFDSFIDPSEEELNESFAEFKANNITDLIIDLRYNTGGYLSIARQLASLVMGAADTTNVCYKLNYNDIVGPSWNESYDFVATESPLGLNRVVFITTRSTASASEVVINSLRPYVDVTLVGDTTHGKPVGMNIWGYPFATASNPSPDYVYVFAPITFEYVNSLDEGGFYDGMVPDILADNDLAHDFGDPEETSLKAAIDFLEGAKTESAVSLHRSRTYSEPNQIPENLLIEPPQSYMK